MGFRISMSLSPSRDRCGSNGGVPGTAALAVLLIKSNTSWSVCLKARLMGKVGKAANRG